ncbi:F-box protein-like protein [Tanacetum coccineum]
MTHLLEKETPFIFSKESIKAFEILKKKLIEALILVAPDWDLPFESICDASDFAVGAVLRRRKTKHFQPIHYASKTMTDAQAHYTTMEKELFAVVKFYSERDVVPTKDLHLTLLNEKIKLDESFFINSCFSRLRLKGCKFNPAGEISWRNLKCFYISEANLDEGLIQNILSGSPLLETLELDHCYGFRRIDITSKSVKKFVFSGYNGGAKRVIEINAPYIVSLTIGDRLVLSKILLLNVTSLVKAELYYRKEGDTETTRKEAEEEMLKGLLVNLSHVKDLKIP